MSVSNTFHTCICLVLQPPFPTFQPTLLSNTALSTPHFPQEHARVPTVPSPSLFLSSVVLTAPWLPLHFFLEFRSVTTVKSCVCSNWQACGFWQRWTLLSLLWQDTTRSISSTQMSSLVKTDQGGAKNIVSIWERTIAQERMVSLDQTAASTFC